MCVWERRTCGGLDVVRSGDVECRCVCGCCPTTGAASCCRRRGPLVCVFVRKPHKIMACLLLSSGKEELFARPHSEGAARSS